MEEKLEHVVRTIQQAIYDLPHIQPVIELNDYENMLRSVIETYLQAPIYPKLDVVPIDFLYFTQAYFPTVFAVKDDYALKDVYYHSDTQVSDDYMVRIGLLVRNSDFLILFKGVLVYLVFPLVAVERCMLTLLLIVAKLVDNAEVCVDAPGLAPFLHALVYGYAGLLDESCYDLTLLLLYSTVGKRLPVYFCEYLLTDEQIIHIGAFVDMAFNYCNYYELDASEHSGENSDIEIWSLAENLNGTHQRMDYEQHDDVEPVQKLVYQDAGNNYNSDGRYSGVDVRLRPRNYSGDDENAIYDALAYNFYDLKDRSYLEMRNDNSADQQRANGIFEAVEPKAKDYQQYKPCYKHVDLTVSFLENAYSTYVIDTVDLTVPDEIQKTKQQDCHYSAYKDSDIWQLDSYFNKGSDVYASRKQHDSQVYAKSSAEPAEPHYLREIGIYEVTNSDIASFNLQDYKKINSNANPYKQKLYFPFSCFAKLEMYFAYFSSHFKPLDQLKMVKRFQQSYRERLISFRPLYLANTTFAQVTVLLQCYSESRVLVRVHMAGLNASAFVDVHNSTPLRAQCACLFYLLCAFQGASIRVVTNLEALQQGIMGLVSWVSPSRGLADYNFYPHRYYNEIIDILCAMAVFSWTQPLDIVFDDEQDDFDVDAYEMPEDHKSAALNDYKIDGLTVLYLFDSTRLFTGQIDAAVSKRALEYLDSLHKNANANKNSKSISTSDDSENQCIHISTSTNATTTLSEETYCYSNAETSESSAFDNTYSEYTSESDAYSNSDSTQDSELNEQQLTSIRSVAAEYMEPHQYRFVEYRRQVDIWVRGSLTQCQRDQIRQIFYRFDLKESSNSAY